MSIPSTEEARIGLDYIRNSPSLRLYSNDVTPSETSTLATFTQVAGGGYAVKSLDVANWVTTPGDPTEIEYPVQTFTFTGATTAPGTIYGYYLVDPVTGLYIGANRFPGAVLPFSPVAGSTITFTPLVQVS